MSQNNEIEVIRLRGTVTITESLENQDLARHQQWCDRNIHLFD
jgi:hypothetical protein